MLHTISPPKGAAMQHGSGERTTAWTRDVGEAPAQRLDRNLQVDVCVVGAGIAGLTTAYMLTQRGRTVAVLDAGPVGGGETSRTTAHLSHVLGARYFELERLHGVDGARLAADSHTQAITAIETIVRQEQIACDFERVPGYLFLGPGDDPNILARELDAVHRLGLTGVRRVDAVPASLVESRTIPLLSRSGAVPSDEVPVRADAGHSGARRTRLHADPCRLHGGWRGRLRAHQRRP